MELDTKINTNQPTSTSSTPDKVIFAISENKKIIVECVTHENYQFSNDHKILRMEGAHEVWNALGKYLIQMKKYNS